MTTGRVEDKELIDRLQRGDRLAFEVMVNRYGARIFTLVRRMLRQRQEAEDLTQDILLQAYRKVATFRRDCSLYTWLYRIAVNMTLNRLRVKTPQWDSLDPNEPRLDGLPGPDRQLEDAELREQLEKSLWSLDEASRLLFVMREIQGMSYEEIAKVLQCSPEALRARLHRTRQRLQERLRPYLEGGDTRVHAH